MNHTKLQSGAVLIVGLIMLLVLTVISVTLLRTTTVEERMAGNLRDKNIAFQSSEGALREAVEVDLPSQAFDGSVAGYGTEIQSFLDGSGNAVSESEYWAKYFNWTASAAAATQVTGVKSPPKYYVEQLTVYTGIRKAGPQKRAYRITARSNGASDNSLSIVQGVVMLED